MARPQGTPNKATTVAREAFNALIDDRIDMLGQWIDRTAKDDPKAAFYMVMDLAAFCVPRVKATPPAPPPLPLPIIRTSDGDCVMCGRASSDTVRITREIVHRNAEVPSP